MLRTPWRRNTVLQVGPLRAIPTTRPLVHRRGITRAAILLGGRFSLLRPRGRDHFLLHSRARQRPLSVICCRAQSSPQLRESRWRFEAVKERKPFNSREKQTPDLFNEREQLAGEVEGRKEVNMEGNYRLFSWPHVLFTAGSLFHQIKAPEGQGRPSTGSERQK